MFSWIWLLWYVLILLLFFGFDMPLFWLLLVNSFIYGICVMLWSVGTRLVLAYSDRLSWRFRSENRNVKCVRSKRVLSVWFMSIRNYGSCTCYVCCAWLVRTMLTIIGDDFVCFGSINLLNLVSLRTCDTLHRKSWR